MGHSGRTDFTGFDFLFEISHRDVSPEIPVEVDNNIIDPSKVIEQSCKIIVIGNLGRVCFPFDF